MDPEAEIPHAPPRRQSSFGGSYKGNGDMSAKAAPSKGPARTPTTAGIQVLQQQSCA